MAQATVVQSTEGDWVGVYADGMLAKEGHSISPADALRCFVNAQIEEVHFMEVDLDRCPQGPIGLPLDLGGIPEEARS